MASVKKYLYDGMYVVVEEMNGCVAIVQPVDDHGNNYGDTLTAIQKKRAGDLPDSLFRIYKEFFLLIIN